VVGWPTGELSGVSSARHQVPQAMESPIAVKRMRTFKVSFEQVESASGLPCGQECLGRPRIGAAFAANRCARWHGKLPDLAASSLRRNDTTVTLAGFPFAVY
jgi:hypothetical protein